MAHCGAGIVLPSAGGRDHGSGTSPSEDIDKCVDDSHLAYIQCVGAIGRINDLTLLGTLVLYGDSYSTLPK